MERIARQKGNSRSQRYVSIRSVSLRLLLDNRSIRTVIAHNKHRLWRKLAETNALNNALSTSATSMFFSPSHCPMSHLCAPNAVLPKDMFQRTDPHYSMNLVWGDIPCAPHGSDTFLGPLLFVDIDPSNSCGFEVELLCFTLMNFLVIFSALFDKSTTLLRMSTCPLLFLFVTFVDRDYVV